MDSYFHVFARLPEDTRARTAVINDEMLRTFSKTDASAAALQPPPEGAGGGEPPALGLGEWKSLLSALGLVPGLVSPLDMVDVFQQTAVGVAHTTAASALRDTHATDVARAEGLEERERERRLGLTEYRQAYII